MDHYQRIAGNFQQTIELIAMSVDSLAGPIERANEVICDALLKDRKIISCGNGPDGALAQLFASNLLNRFEHERPALPALSLGSQAVNLSPATAGDAVNDVFSRQINALGQAGDVLVCISSEHSHANLLNAIQAAQSRNMTVVGLSNNSDGELHELLRSQDVEIAVTSARRARLVELHTMIIQSLCEMIDSSLFGNYEQE